MNYWLIKSEPYKYHWDDLVKDGQTHWDGVRNYSARLHMMDMKLGDLLLFYHSNEGKEVVGVAKVVNEHYPDPTSDDPKWVVVDVAPEHKLKKPVTLAEIKAEPTLSEMKLVKIGRLSVAPVTKAEFDKVIEMSEQ